MRSGEASSDAEVEASDAGEQTTGTALPPASPGRTILLFLLAWGVIAALALFISAELWFVVLMVAFAAGVALERYRQARVPLPPTLAETPWAWWTTLTSGVGPAYLAGALLLIAGAAAVLSFSFGGRSAPTATTSVPSPPDAGQQRAVKMKPEPVGREFTVAGATFRVIPSPGAAWAREIEAQHPARGRRWVVMAIEVTNVNRSHFNPGLLVYQLSGPQGALYSPDRGGVVGPDSLGTRQGLPSGGSAEERLAFEVPAGSTPLRLLIEPVQNGNLQVRVRLPVG